MLIDLVLLGAAVLLAGGAFLLKRHAGTLILAVMAGALLASTATGNAVAWLHARGYESTAVHTEPLVGIVLTLAPALLGWLAVPKASGKRRIVGAVVFGFASIALVAPFVGLLFAENLVAQARYDEVLINYRGAIIASTLAYALLDLYLGKMGARHDASHKKK